MPVLLVPALTSRWHLTTVESIWAPQTLACGLNFGSNPFLHDTWAKIRFNCFKYMKRKIQEKGYYLATCENFITHKKLFIRSQLNSFVYTMPVAILSLPWLLLSCDIENWCPIMLFYLEVSTGLLLLLLKLLQSSSLRKPTFVSFLTYLITMDYNDPLLNNIHHMSHLYPLPWKPQFFHFVSFEPKWILQH